MSIQTILSEYIENETEKSLKGKSDNNYCLRCGRKLKDPDNRIKGMGPICWEKSHLEQSRRLFDANNNT